MKIYANKSLNLRRGKWAAQLSHAYMKMILESCTKTDDNKLIMTHQKMKHIKTHVNKLVDSPETLDVTWVEGEESLDIVESENPKFSATIIDHGRTELKGVKTKTCVIVDDANVLSKTSEHKFREQSIFSKQVIALRDNIGTHKQHQYAYAIAMSVKHLIEAFVHEETVHTLNLNNHKELDVWLSGAFAKICVRFSDEQDMESRVGRFKKNNLKATLYAEGKMACVVFTAATNDELTYVSSDLRLY